MVDLTSNNSIQQHSINPTSIRYGHIQGCMNTGMGGPIQWNIDGGTLGSPGIQEPHQKFFLRTQTRKPQHIDLQMDRTILQQLPTSTREEEPSHQRWRSKRSSYGQSAIGTTYG